MENSEISPARKTATKVLFEAFKVLKENGGQLRSKDVINQIRNRIELTDWEKERFEKSGYVRWESILHFYTINATKSGFLRKDKRMWILTEEGEKAMKKGPAEFFELAKEGYKKWRLENPVENKESEDAVISEETEELQTLNLEKAEEQAFEGIKEFIYKKNPYEFQDLVAALLKAMGYYISFVAARGKDGGVDIIAYQDPLGIKTPRVKVQVKHKPNTASPVDDIRKLLGIMNEDVDVGIVVSSGGFTSESVIKSRDSHKHVELINIDRFIELWIEFYPKLTDEDKNQLPLQSIYFLGSHD
ncbi:MAG TPA: Mrr restriction system protein [Ignavibacteria bacterium]|mgnify:CR=1 FL=1|nr:Mrr restriction system protein [Ignavibacteria bacterium]HMQ99200.1 Mrr restriction system protein [Ignavibacteria bacterium]